MVQKLIYKPAKKVHIQKSNFKYILIQEANKIVSKTRNKYIGKLRLNDLVLFL